jgi:hypothetical protein
MVSVGFMTGDRAEMGDYLPVGLNFLSDCGKKARRGSLSIRCGSPGIRKGRIDHHSKIDFVFQTSPHCLEFHWTATSRSGGTIYDRQTYIYCPRQSMVSQIQH